MDALALPFADSNFIPLGLRTGIGRGGHDPVVVVDPHVSAEKGHDLGPLGRSVCQTHRIVSAKMVVMVWKRRAADT